MLKTPEKIRKFLGKLYQKARQETAKAVCGKTERTVWWGKVGNRAWWGSWCTVRRKGQKQICPHVKRDRPNLNHYASSLLYPLFSLLPYVIFINFYWHCFRDCFIL